MYMCTYLNRLLTFNVNFVYKAFSKIVYLFHGSIPIFFYKKVNIFTIKPHKAPHHLILYPPHPCRRDFVTFFVVGSIEKKKSQLHIIPHSFLYHPTLYATSELLVLVGFTQSITQYTFS